MKKKLSKHEAGKRLNEEGRLSPLEVFQRRMEHYDRLARDEIALGDLEEERGELHEPNSTPSTASCCRRRAVGTYGAAHQDAA